jgi:hypothetical protein
MLTMPMAMQLKLPMTMEYMSLPSGPQQPPLFIWFWLKNSLKIKKLKRHRKKFPWWILKILCILTEKRMVSVHGASDLRSIYFLLLFSLVLLVYKISGGVHTKHGWISNPSTIQIEHKECLLSFCIIIF